MKNVPNPVPPPLPISVLSILDWSILGQLGLSNVFITNANRVERFYFDCQALHPEVMRRELLIGLEQVWEGNLGRFGGLKDGVAGTVCTTQFPILSFKGWP